MSVIDKTMYEELKNWCDRNRPKHQFMLYVNSHDHSLTSATIRKLMFEIDKEDIHGEEYVAFYSAESFYRNMREYYSHIGDLYRRKHSEDDTLEKIIADLPSTCGWITLIVEDMEALSDQPEKMQEMMQLFLCFAVKRANVILIGNGTYEEVFSECEYAMNEMADGMNANVEDNVLMIGCINQDETPNRERIVHESPEKQRDELDFYWDTTCEQLEKGYFDYDVFKPLYKETMEYLIPRVIGESVYRKDLFLIENIGAIWRHKPIDGCGIWEFEAARQFSVKLHKAIVNRYGYNDDLSAGIIALDIVIKDPDKEYGAIQIGGSLSTTVNITVDTACMEMDKLAGTILEHTYQRDATEFWKRLQEEYGEGNNLKSLLEHLGVVKGTVDSLMEDVKDAANRTVNKEHGNKVHRYTGDLDLETVLPQEEGEEESGVKILERDYDIDLSEVKGIEKLEPEQTAGILECKRTRFIVIPAEEKITVNEDGDSEMTAEAQTEYDGFVSQVRQRFIREDIWILDEGFGEGEDELEWHITGCVVNPKNEESVVGIMEIDTCVRTEEEPS